MDWKSTAVISGAGIVATWFFSMPPARVPDAERPAVRTPQSVSSIIDIQKEADRLHVRVPQEAHYSQPSRNPFRFTQRREPARPTTGVTPSPVVPVVPVAPPPPRMTLDGVAADADRRTAILHTDAGVVLAKEGDEVAGYRVEKIAADAVELRKIDDGSALTLGLR